MRSIRDKAFQWKLLRKCWKRGLHRNSLLKAVEDLEIIVRYISLTNPSAARKVGQTLLEKTKELGQLPFKGQMVPEFNNPDLRQLILKPYRIVYRVEEDKKLISIARFWHSYRERLEL